MNFSRDYTLLSHGPVTDYGKSTYLGCLFHHKCLFQSEYKVLRDDFTSDGDLYGLDKAVLYMRQVVIIDDVRPAHCFDSFGPAILVLVSVTRLQLTDSKLFGRHKEGTKRSDRI